MGAPTGEAKPPMTRNPSPPADPCPSSQVSWWDVHLYVQQHLAVVGHYPMAGTPAWCDLPDDDPRKLAAVLDAGQHHALRVETAQQALAQASRAVAASQRWSAVRRGRGPAYIPRAQVSA